MGLPWQSSVKTHARTARLGIQSLGWGTQTLHVTWYNHKQTKQTKNRKNSTSLKAKINSEGYSTLSYKIPPKKVPKGRNQPTETTVNSQGLSP